MRGRALLGGAIVTVVALLLVVGWGERQALRGDQMPTATPEPVSTGYWLGDPTDDWGVKVIPDKLITAEPLTPSPGDVPVPTPIPTAAP